MPAWMASCPRSVNLSKRIQKVNYRIRSEESKRGYWPYASAPLFLSNPRRLPGGGLNCLGPGFDRLGLLVPFAFNFDAASLGRFLLRKNHAQNAISIVRCSS